MSKKIVVVKYGGSVLEEPRYGSQLAEDLTALFKTQPLAIVHGGGKAINAMLERCRIPTEFRGGLRVTDIAAMEIIEMVLSGTVNAAIAATLLARGVPAIGLSGRSSGIFKAQIRSEFGRVGEIDRVNPEPVSLLLEGGYLPVVSPVAADSQGSALNINADEAAAELAGALKAATFIYVTDVPGISVGGQVIERLSLADGEALLHHPEITGGMIPKLRCALRAIRTGVQTVLMIDGRADNAITRALQGEVAGTVLTQ